MEQSVCQQCLGARVRASNNEVWGRLHVSVPASKSEAGCTMLGVDLSWFFFLSLNIKRMLIKAGKFCHRSAFIQSVLLSFFFY